MEILLLKSGVCASSIKPKDSIRQRSIIFFVIGVIL